MNYLDVPEEMLDLPVSLNEFKPGDRVRIWVNPECDKKPQATMFIGSKEVPYRSVGEHDPDVVNGLIGTVLPIPAFLAPEPHHTHTVRVGFEPSVFFLCESSFYAPHELEKIEGEV